jgi:chorismate mutase
MVSDFQGLDIVVKTGITENCILISKSAYSKAKKSKTKHVQLNANVSLRPNHDDRAPVNVDRNRPKTEVKATS